MHLNTVLLPDRTVLATGGAAVEEHKVNAALEAEIFDAAAGTWRTPPRRAWRGCITRSRCSRPTAR